MNNDEMAEELAGFNMAHTHIHSRAEELIACLEGEIAKRDARIVELERAAESLRLSRDYHHEQEVEYRRRWAGLYAAQSPAGVDGLCRTREQWMLVDARLCADQNSPSANFYLIQDAKLDIERLHRAVEDRDQRAQRIGELASHLEFAVTVLTVAGLAGNAQVEAMRAALSAGKDSDQ